jgi:uncharacterized phage infection (PIP) family protein YhgE
MKNIPCLLTLVAGLILSAGCASTGNDKAADTASALKASANKITKGHALINESLSTLNDLVDTPKPDLRKQFKAFNSAVEDLAATAQEVSTMATEMQAAGADYFKKWDKEMAAISNEDIRTRGAARQAEVTARFQTILQEYGAAKSAFAPFMSDLRDVQKYLSTDLTAGGLGAIKGAATKANQDAIPLRAAVGKLTQEFKAMGVALSPTTSN